MVIHCDIEDGVKFSVLSLSNLSNCSLVSDDIQGIQKKEFCYYKTFFFLRKIQVKGKNHMIAAYETFKTKLML